MNSWTVREIERIFFWRSRNTEQKEVKKWERNRKKERKIKGKRERVRGTLDFSSFEEKLREVRERKRIIEIKRGIYIYIQREREND